MSTLYKWLNHEKSRFYTIVVKKDVTNDIILSHTWGGCHSNRGGKKNLLVQTDDEVQAIIDKMMKRRKYRGYDLIAPL
jgi:hypothetical protein